MSEADFVTALRALPLHPAARGLMDDAAVIDFSGHSLVLTHDMIVEGVHFLPADPPADVAWKLVAVNLSDLAAKGARPLGVLLGFVLGDATWDRAFAAGLGKALTHFEVTLLGGDTVSGPSGAPRSLGLTAIGEAAAPVPSRSGAKPGDHLWVSGRIGDAGLGLSIAQGEPGPEALLSRYRRPEPRLALGQALGPRVSAMMDVSDGLLIDAARMAAASGVGLTIDLDALAAIVTGTGLDRLLDAATAGDDYELLFTAPPGTSLAPDQTPITRIGCVLEGAGLALLRHGSAVPLPARLGYQHG